jgi:DNA adenine methylase
MAVVDRRGLRPFLKWVGGKRQLLPVLRRFYPPVIGRYFEPFLGSGAVFFDLAGRHLLNGDGAVLTDDNADLVGCYRHVGRSLAAVLAALDRLAGDHAARGRACYMQVRDEHFNPLRAAWRDRGGALDDYSPELAAMLIYLNRTGYNGLFRVNASGDFNVPPGRYDAPRVVDRPLLTRVSEVLAAPGIRVDHAAFDRVLDEARAGDFVYFDPPYAPLSKTANFRGYTGRGFSDADQGRLQRISIALARRGVHVLLSNSVAPSVSRLYEDNDEVSAAGLSTWRVPARRAVNSRADRRGSVEELVVSNVRPAAGDASLQPAAGHASVFTGAAR